MHDIKLILSDIDGTILPYGCKKIPARTIDAFHAALDAGIHVGVATGRNALWVRHFFEDDARCAATCVASNGSEVFLEGEKIREARLNTDALRRLAERMHEVSGAGMLVFKGVTPYMVAGSVDDLEKCFPSYAAICEQAGDDIFDEAPIKANLFFGSLPAEYYQALVDELGASIAELDFDIPQPGFGNVMPHGSNKGTAVDVLAEALGIGLDQVVVFGDNGNDVSMLSHVPNSVAVQGASEEAHAAARWHIGACEDEAVGEAVARIAAGEWPFQR